jgi:hypothetical protein
MEKRYIKILIRISSDLSRLEDYLNKGYRIMIHSKHGLRDYFMLNNEPEVTYREHEVKEIIDFRVITVKNNPDYVSTIDLLKKEGFIIDQITPTSVVLIKYK